MSTMAELAIEYRKESARLAQRVEERKKAGAPEWEINVLLTMLREMRVKQRLLSSYYEAPRDSSITMCRAYAPKHGGNDDC